MKYLLLLYKIIDIRYLLQSVEIFVPVLRNLFLDYCLNNMNNLIESGHEAASFKNEKNPINIQH